MITFLLFAWFLQIIVSITLWARLGKIESIQEMTMKTLTDYSELFQTHQKFVTEITQYTNMTTDALNKSNKWMNVTTERLGLYSKWFNELFRRTAGRELASCPPEDSRQ